MLGHDAQGTSLAYYDPDSFDWIAWQTTSFHATSGAASATGVVLVGIGPGPDHLLCDVTLDNAVVWGPTKCHTARPVFDGGEIAVPPPQVVAAYHTSYSDLVAVALHDGQWSAPWARGPRCGRSPRHGPRGMRLGTR